MLKLPIKKGTKVWGITPEGRTYQWIWTGSIYDMREYGFLGLYKTRGDAQIAITKVKKFIRK